MWKMRLVWKGEEGCYSTEGRCGQAVIWAETQNWISYQFLITSLLHRPNLLQTPLLSTETVLMTHVKPVLYSSVWWCSSCRGSSWSGVSGGSGSLAPLSVRGPVLLPCSQITWTLVWNRNSGRYPPHPPALTDLQLSNRLIVLDELDSPGSTTTLDGRFFSSPLKPSADHPPEMSRQTNDNSLQRSAPLKKDFHLLLIFLSRLIGVFSSLVHFPRWTEWNTSPDG